MIGLDTNVLLRYLVRDDTAQAARAKAAIEHAAADGAMLLICAPVLCELAWVLASTYRYSREALAAAIDEILATHQFEVEHGDEARAALNDCRSTKADFADAFLGRIHSALGAEATVTFDRDLKPLETFRVL